MIVDKNFTPIQERFNKKQKAEYARTKALEEEKRLLSNPSVVKATAKAFKDKIESDLAKLGMGKRKPVQLKDMIRSR